jgi:DNA-binding IclR family transcriptional regulator
MTRLLYSLERAGFLERDSDTGKYRLTYKLHRIGSVYIKQAGLYKEAMPLLRELSAKYKETVHLGVLVRYEVTFIDWIESRQQIGLLSLTGMNLPAHCTASGKVLLSHQSRENLEKFFQSFKVKSYTANTITDPKKLRENLDVIRDQGYALDYAEFQEDVVGIAAPVWDTTGDVVASISVAGPLFRMKNKRFLNKIIHDVKETSQRVSRRLGYLGKRHEDKMEGVL